MRTLVLALFMSQAFAAEPPDVVHGERYDGRAPQKNQATSPAEQLLVVPRVIFYLPRLLMKGVAAVAKPVMEYNQRHHVNEYLYRAFTWDQGRIGVRPVIEWELGFKPTGGISLFDDDIPHGGRLTASTAVGGLGVLLQNVDFSVPFLHRKLELSLHADFYRRDDELYTGIGMKAHPFARYAFDQADLKLSFSAKPMAALRIVTGVDFGARRFGNGVPYGGDRPIEEVYCYKAVNRCAGVDVPGFDQGTQFVRERLELHIDSRKTELSSGFMTDVGVEYTHGLGGDHSNYLRLRGHVGAAFDVWRHRSIYLGFSADDEIAFGDTPIPFSELVQLGGADDLRGFRRGRFRDASSLLATVEYRWPVWMWMDGSLFFDYGGVFGPKFAGFSLGELKPDLGVGFRVHTQNKFIIRIQLAYGFGDGVRLVIAGNGNPS